MEKINNNNLTKKEISKFISKKIGLSNHYIDNVVEDLIVSLKETIIGGKLHVLNFGSFKITYKKERVGRNPKTKIEYQIKAQKSLSFSSSKNLEKNIGNN